MEQIGVEPGVMRLWVSATPDEVRDRLDRRLRLAGANMGGAVSGSHAEFYLPHVSRVSKATQLVVEIEQAEGGTVLRGQFIQHPYVFILSLVAIVVAAFGGVLALSYAVAQWSMDQLPTGLLGVVICAAVAGAAYWVLRARHQVGGEQSEELRKFVEEAVQSVRSEG